MNSNGLYYFAHPYTTKDAEGRFVPESEEANFQLANYRASRLFLLGFNVYSPISHTHPIHRSCPEFLTKPGDAMWEMWCGLDLDFMKHTDFAGIILAPGWEDSRGCVAERKAFMDRGKEVYLFADILSLNKRKGEQ